MHAKSFFLQKNQMQPILSKSLHTFYNATRQKIGDLFIVRHAESDHNVHGFCAGYLNRSKPTEDGLEKTRQAGKLLSKSGVKINKLYVSPLDRALMTAQVLLNDLPPIEMTTHHALAERHFGVFTGLSKNQIKEKLNPDQFNQYIHNQYFFPPDIAPGHPYFQSKDLYGVWPENHKGESYQCVMNRLSPFLEKIKEELLNGQNILIVGHSHNLQILQMLLYGNAFEQGIEKYKLEHATPVKFTLSPHSDKKLMVKEQLKFGQNSMKKASCCSVQI